MFGQLVIFEVSGQLYAVDSAFVRTVEADSQIRPLAGIPECIEGVCEMRGEIVPICNMYKKFNLRGTVSDRPQIVYVNSVEGCLGWVVDTVREIGAVMESNQMQLPNIIRADSTSYVGGIVSHGGNLITVINPDKILTPEEIVQLKKAMKKK